MDPKTIRALVTGGSSGIGYETARQIITAGGQAIICGRNKETLEKAAHALGTTGIVADVSREEDILRLFKAADDLTGGLNTLINNAAYGYFAPLVDIETAKFNEMMATNLTGAMMAGREAARLFIPRSYGNIVNIASTAGLKGFAAGTAYATSKFAVRGMTECWRDELRKYNIRVMLVNPSEVQTNFFSGRPLNDTKLEAEEIAHTIMAMLSMRDRGFITEATIFATNPR